MQTETIKIKWYEGNLPESLACAIDKLNERIPTKYKGLEDVSHHFGAFTKRGQFINLPFELSYEARPCHGAMMAEELNGMPAYALVLIALVRIPRACEDCGETHETVGVGLHVLRDDGYAEMWFHELVETDDGFEQLEPTALISHGPATCAGCPYAAEEGTCSCHD